MKITIETLEDDKAKISLELNGKTFSEIWSKNGQIFMTEGKAIYFQMQEMGLDIEGTELCDFLGDIDVETFLFLKDIAYL